MDASQILTQNVDKTQLPPLHQKRILAFVNHFLISSCKFLNEFAVQCETKFIELERKMQKVEAALIMLEAKLDSIPDSENIVDQTLNNNNNNSNKNNNEEEQIIPMKVIEEDEDNDNHDNHCDKAVGVKAYEHEDFRKYFKMLQVGVPVQAVKIKMKVEGLDPNILDDPNKFID